MTAPEVTEKQNLYFGKSKSVVMQNDFPP